MPKILGLHAAWLLAVILYAAPAYTEIDDQATPDSQEADAEPVITSIFGIEPLKRYDLPFKDNYPTGSFEILPDHRFLFIGKCGTVYFAKLDQALELTSSPRYLRRDATLGEADPQTDSIKSPLVYCYELSGVKDSLLVGDHLYVAYSAWDETQNGVRLAVSEFRLDLEHNELAFVRDIFASQPAVKEPILGHQVGGKLALGENDKTLFLATGDFSRPEFVQNPDTTIGKVIRIDLDSLKAENYATGIRSPSGGLFYDREARELWLSEHGPKGGDEINLIKRGRNYGWPLVSYGTIYERGGMGNYYGNKLNTHEGYEKPAMTFVPSIGVGPIARYPATGKNEYWENDYFVAGMAALKLLRIRKEGEHLVYAEPVLEGYRIRAIKIDSRGDFYLKTDHDQLLVTDQSRRRMP